MYSSLGQLLDVFHMTLVRLRVVDSVGAQFLTNLESLIIDVHGDHFELHGLSNLDRELTKTPSSNYSQPLTLGQVAAVNRVEGGLSKSVRSNTKSRRSIAY